MTLLPGWAGLFLSAVRRASEVYFIFTSLLQISDKRKIYRYTGIPQVLDVFRNPYVSATRSIREAISKKAVSMEKRKEI
ncbi:PTPA-CTERM sorting domain-containing protein [Sphingobacterium spiritivorum]|uniref:PTPA-CTERM sorting domain-containing protein n=1 Tax=Sphingobacterium spiritivorum TaxID=258 RepID=UPI0039818985